MKIWKNVLTMALIAMFAFGIFAVPRSLAQTTTVSILPVDDTGLVSDGDSSTPEFSVDIMIENVAALLAFDLYLHYDTNVLTAVGGEGYYPFTYSLTTPANDPKGVIHVGASYPLPEYTGFYTTDPYSILRVDFSVDGMGASMLDMENVVLSDIIGQPITGTIVEGWFRNVAGAPIAWFAPMDPLAGELVEFTSTSIDPEGTIVAFDWDWGDGTAHGTTETATHAWTAEATYAVTLTVTDNDGLTDSQARSIEITPPPLAGAIAIRGHPSQRHLDFNKYGSHKQWLKGWAQNIDPTRSELVRVDLEVWSSNYGQVGAVMTPNQWLGPGVLGTFQGTFDMMDPKWMFVGGRMTEDEFTVYVRVYHADFFYDNDPNNPHWAQVAGPEVSYTFMVSETAPVPVIASSFNSASGVLTLDGSGSYDADMKWGDSVSGHRWLIYEQDVGQIAQLFGDIKDFQVPEDGYYRWRLRVEDMFGVRIQTGYTAWVYLDVP
jgi:PKD repeat protein